MDILTINSFIQQYLFKDKKVSAPTETVGSCEDRINTMIKTKMFLIPSICFDLLKKEKTAILIQNRDLIILGYRNIILMKSMDREKNKANRISIIAGENTHLTQISLLAVDNKEKNIFVLNEKSILILDKETDGNIYPLNIIKLDKIISADSMVINEKNYNIIFKGKTGEIILTVPYLEPTRVATFPHLIKKE